MHLYSGLALHRFQAALTDFKNRIFVPLARMLVLRDNPGKSGMVGKYTLGVCVNARDIIVIECL